MSCGCRGEPPTDVRNRCWNCLGVGHSFNSCPERRNYPVLNAMRAAWAERQRDMLPIPARDALRTYLVSGDTPAERAKRLALAQAFTPGRVSLALADALTCHVSKQNQLEIKRDRDWPWIYDMLDWGYPSGWVSTKGELNGLRSPQAR